MTAPRKARVGAAFAAADDYDMHAVVQREVAGIMAGQMAALDLPADARILEIGCGTGLLAGLRPAALAGADWLMTDLAPAMVARCRDRFAGEAGMRFAVLDGEAPVFDPPEAPFDLICSNLAVQWFDDLAAGLSRLFALVAPGGHLLVSTLAAGTFATWRQAHADVRLVPGTPRFPTIAQLAEVRVGGQPLQVERTSIEQRHSDGAGFLRSVKAIGAGTPVADHRPLGAAHLRSVMRRFEAAGAVAEYEVALCRIGRPAA